MGVSFTGTNIGTTVGDLGTILRTTNGGTDWIEQSSGTLTPLLSVSSPDGINIIAVGYSGTICRTTNGGVTFIGKGNNITNSQEFILSQNYPNPFNPTITINYFLAKTGNVKLTVYNAIGSKVTNIVNEYKPAGSYSVQFNGTNLASGIYLYRLESGNYSAAKKFILMK